MTAPSTCLRCHHALHDWADPPGCEVEDCACGWPRCPACRGSGVKPRVGDSDPGSCPVCDGKGVAPRAADLLPEAEAAPPETRQPGVPPPPPPEPVPDWVAPLAEVGVAEPGEAVTPPVAPGYEAALQQVLERLAASGPTVSVGLTFKLSQGPPDYQSAELSLHVSGLRAGTPEEEIAAALGTGKLAYEAMKLRIGEQAREVLREWADGTWAR